MKRTLALLCVLSVLTPPAFSGVVKKTRSEVTFKGFGRFSTSQSEKLVPQKHWLISGTISRARAFWEGWRARPSCGPGTSERSGPSSAERIQARSKKREYTVSQIKKLSKR